MNSRPPWQVLMDGAAREVMTRNLDVTPLENVELEVFRRMRPTAPPGTPLEHIDSLFVELLPHRFGAGVDHLRTWRNAQLGGPLPLYAWATLARGAFDAAVVILWALDGPLDERRTRIAGLQVHDHHERRKLEDNMAKRARPDGSVFVKPLDFARGGMSGSARLESFNDRLHLAGITAAGWPRWTWLYERYALDPDPTYPEKGLALYRILSANAHAEHWGLLTADLGDTSAMKVGDLGVVSANDDLAAWTAKYARLAMRRALHRIRMAFP